MNKTSALGKKDPNDTRTPTERLVEFAENFKGNGIKREEDLAWRQQSVEKRLAHAMVHGMTQFIV